MSDYTSFSVGDRFVALFVGYTGVYRVKKVFEGWVNYEGEVAPCKEWLVETKSGLVWTTHVCGSLLDFSGSYYTPSPACKTWLSRKLDKGERSTEQYALGEK